MDGLPPYSMTPHGPSSNSSGSGSHPNNPNNNNMGTLFPFGNTPGNQMDAMKLVERFLTPDLMANLNQAPLDSAYQNPSNPGSSMMPPFPSHGGPPFMLPHPGPLPNPGPSNSNKSATQLENLPIEELQARKNYARSHRFLPVLMELVSECKKDNLLPPVDQLGYLYEGQAASIDMGLDDFLQSQGIETTPLNSEDPLKNSERDEFISKLEQMREKYKDELERLNRVCTEFCTRMVGLLNEQATMRPLLEQETHMKMQGIQQKFDFVRNQLRQSVCNAILVLQKQYNQQRKKGRTLPKKATEHLSNWFFDHINDPYPSEEEKSMLAASGGLTITQVNYWFGNKRIRYKRKCLEEESKRALMEEQERQPQHPYDDTSDGQHIQMMHQQMLPNGPFEGHPSLNGNGTEEPSPKTTKRTSRKKGSKARDKDNNNNGLNNENTNQQSTSY